MLPCLSSWQLIKTRSTAAFCEGIHGSRIIHFLSSCGFTTPASCYSVWLSAPKNTENLKKVFLVPWSYRRGGLTVEANNPRPLWPPFSYSRCYSFSIRWKTIATGRLESVSSTFRGSQMEANVVVSAFGLRLLTGRDHRDIKKSLSHWYLSETGHPLYMGHIDAKKEALCTQESQANVKAAGIIWKILASNSAQMRRTVRACCHLLSWCLQIVDTKIHLAKDIYLTFIICSSD